VPKVSARFVARVLLGAALAAVPAEAAQQPQRYYFVRLRGVVCDATNGAPIPGATVMLGSEARFSNAPSVRETTLIADANGRFTLSAFTGQSIDVAARAPGYFEGRHGQMWPHDAGRPVRPQRGTRSARSWCICGARQASPDA
jgi:hypothetical protein